ncbi:membrane protein [Klebsiella pneumoniae subsp. ozaenae]|uniref:Membrane protein n=1 Tax=Klebsiella pneumoniae subsp. ozaenae TaxID=574 RepID=A0A377ZT48_KLEPO|nr:membrane protein [Klebsiella pneumoniae subsp. ozaenae]
MKHVHKLAWIGLFVNIIICFVARNLLLDEGQLNFHSRADGVWSWLVLALFIAVVVQAISIMLSGRYPYLAIVLGVCWRHRDGARQRVLSGWQYVQLSNAD